MPGMGKVLPVPANSNKLLLRGTMGLDSTVFYNSTRFASHPLRKYFDVDKETGEIFSVVDTVFDRDIGVREAIEIRLGNAEEIWELLNEFVPVIGGHSLIVSKILYQPQVVPVRDFNQLLTEIDTIVRSEIGGKQAVGGFISNLRMLIEVGLREENPIMFL